MDYLDKKVKPLIEPLLIDLLNARPENAVKKLWYWKKKLIVKYKDQYVLTWLQEQLNI